VIKIDIDYCRKWRKRDPSTYVKLHAGNDFKSAIDSLSQWDFPEVILSGLNQAGFEYFCDTKAGKFEIICLNHCNKVSDFSPLKNLQRLKFLIIDWNNAANSLWDMQNNSSLVGLCMEDTKKITNLDEISKAPILRELYLAAGSMPESKWELESLSFLAAAQFLEKVYIGITRLKDDSALPLTKMQNLKELRLRTDLFETEQYAMLTAKLKNVIFSPNQPYFAYPKTSPREKNVLVVGRNKPPTTETSPRLAQYKAEWEAYIAHYEQ
jgi:hypothetical protein